MILTIENTHIVLVRNAITNNKSTLFEIMLLKSHISNIVYMTYVISIVGSKTPMPDEVILTVITE